MGEGRAQRAMEVKASKQDLKTLRFKQERGRGNFQRCREFKGSWDGAWESCCFFLQTGPAPPEIFDRPFFLPPLVSLWSKAPKEGTQREGQMSKMHFVLH